jgi:hypothetical protein
MNPKKTAEHIDIERTKENLLAQENASFTCLPFFFFPFFLFAFFFPFLFFLNHPDDTSFKSCSLLRWNMRYFNDVIRQLSRKSQRYPR